MSNKQSLKKRFLLIVLVMISVLSFSAFSTAAYAEKDDMVSDNLKKDSKSSETEKDQSTTNTEENKMPAETTDDTTKASSTGMSAWDYIKVVLALAFVVGLLFVVLKLVNRNNRKYQSNQMVQNLGGVSVGQQKSVQILKVGNSLFLVGIGDDVHILKEITDQEEQQMLLKMHDDKQNVAVQVPYIAEMFTNLKTKFNKKSEEPQSQTGFKEELDAKLEKIKKDRQQQLNGWSEKENKKDE